MSQDTVEKMPVNTWTSFPDAITDKVIIDLGAHRDEIHKLQARIVALEEEIRQLNAANNVLVTVCNRMEDDMNEARRIIGEVRENL